MSEPVKSGSGPAWKWRKINEVAAELGTSGQTIRNAINKKVGFSPDQVPALPFTKRGEDFLVRAQETYDHLQQFGGAAMASRLIKPKGYIEASGAMVNGTDASPETNANGEPMTMDALYDRMMQIASDPNYKPGDKQAMAAVARELRSRQTELLKQQKLVPEEEHVAALKEVGDVWAAAVGEFSNPLAIAIHEAYEKATGERLQDKFMGSIDVMRAVICESANTVIVPKVREHVQMRVDERSEAA